MRFLVTLFLFALCFSAVGQTGTCADPSPLCILNTYDYPLGGNISVTPGNSYGCIPFSPSPSVMGYFYAEVRGPGPMDLKFDSDNNLSVAAWGPFPSLAAATGSCGALANPSACSADPFSNAETITLSGMVGEFFIIFVKGDAPPAYVGQFSVTQTNAGFPGAGGLACRDFTNETIACPGNIVIQECDEVVPDPYDNIFQFIAAGANVDNLCTDRIAIRVDEYENGGLGCAGDPRILERRYWLQDQCGNLATCLQQIAYPVLDEPLELACPLSNAPTQLVTCLDDLVVNVEDIVALNACGIELSFNIGEPQINDSSLGLECDLTCLHYPITVTDECGRVGECTLSFTVYGNKPEFIYDISEPLEECRIEALDIECGDGIDSTIDNWLDTLSVFSTCGNRMNLKTDFDEDNFIDVCDESVFRSQEIVITATDACGRINTCRAAINVIKSEGPKIASQAKDKWVNCSQNADSIFQAYIADNGGAIAFDYCSATTFSTNPANPEYFVSCADEDGLTIEFIASDACGNTNITSGVFKVLNDSEPTISIAPSDQVVDCDDDLNATFDNFIATQAGAQVLACGGISWTTDPVSPVAPSLNNQCEEASTIVTFIGTDECGQQTNVTATFTIIDNTAPLMNGGDNLDVECDENITASIQDWLSNNGGIDASDVCSAVSLTNNFDLNSLDLSNTCYEDPIEVIFIAVDACGNESTQTFNINISDNTPPVFTFVPTNINEEAMAEDACSEVTITTMDVTNGGQTIRTYTATDACGNSTSVSVTFGELDNTPPVITFIPAEVGCDGVLDPNDIIATDDSGQVTVVVNLVSQSGSCNTGYTYIYEVTATDGANNITTETVTYNIPADNTPPVFTFVPENLTFFCSDLVDIPLAIATDDCDDVTITCVETLNDGAVVDDCNNGYGYDIFKVWTATDACGNTATAVTEAWVVPDDYIGPKFEFVPESKIMECGEDASFGEAICTTACGNLQLTFIDEVLQGDCHETGQMIRTWTGIDDCGNVTTAQQIITIPPDTEAPVFTIVPESMTIQNMDDMNFGTPTCEDNCATINHLNIDYVDIPLAEGCGLVRTWTVADLCGNATEASQTIWFDDQEAPIISDIPSQVDVICGDEIVFSNPDITDNMDLVDVTILEQVQENNCTGLPIFTRTWVATDGCGNVNTVTQTATTIDDVAPNFENLTTEKIYTCNDEQVFDQAIAVDHCTEVSSLDFVDKKIEDSTCTNCIEVTLRTWTAIDACGNQAQVSQLIKVLDQDAPTLVINGLATSEFTCGQEPSIASPTTMDDCSDVDLQYEDAIDSETCTAIASFTRTWIATDAVGNVSTATQRFEFVDNTAPVFSNVPSTIQLTCGESMEFITPTANDNCSEVSTTFIDIQQESTCILLPQVLRTWTATDACGNVSEFSQTMIIVDLEAPSFDQAVENIVLTCGESIPAPEDIKGLDDCDQNVSILYDETVYTLGDECTSDAILTRTWTATDACGNMNSISYDIFMNIDNTAPQLVEPLQEKVIHCSQDFVFDTPDFKDNCTEVLDVIIETTTEESACELIQTRVWSVTDACGNQAETSQTIRWIDNEGPEMLFPLNDQILTYEEYLNWDSPTEFSVMDDCGEIDEDATTIAITSNEDCEDYRIQYAITFADRCGNAVDYSFEVQVLDAAPSFTMTEPTELDCGSTFVVFAEGVDPATHDFDWTLHDPSGTWEVMSQSADQIEILAGDDTAEIQLTVNNDLGCEVSQRQTVVCNKSNAVRDIAAINDFVLAPNPVSDALTLSFQSDKALSGSFIIYDVLGRKILQQDAELLVGENQFAIPTSNFDQGTYLLEIATKEGSLIQKFMKL